ncbi:MAG: phage tail protein [Selenomonadaceae bacterium]|nr:phage tail protein [Selenomonadaceae bacterium]
MSNYPNTTLTNAGQDLIAESITEGKALIFTKVELGDGNLAAGQSISTLTALISSKMNVPLSSGSADSGQAKLRFAVGNSGLEEGFFAREVGVFAKAGADGVETLYAYTNGGNYVDFIPDQSRPIDDQIMDVYIVTGNAAEVQIQVDSAAYLTVSDLTEHNESQTAHPDIRAKTETMIQTHNESQTAHPDIRAKTETMIQTHNESQTAHPDIRAKTETMIQTHNGSQTAHADIRALVENLAVVDSVAPTSNKGSVAEIINGVANMLKQIKGDRDWKTTPAISLASILSSLGTNFKVTTDQQTGVFSVPALGITGLMAQNGYISLGRLFGGLILQWGIYSLNTNSWKSYNFPIAFQSACYGVVANMVPDAGIASQASQIPITIASYSETGFYAGTYGNNNGWGFIAFALGK